MCSHLRPHCTECPFPSPHLKGAAIRNSGPCQARDSNAAQGNTQDMEATLANLLRKECQGFCSETRRPSRPASRIQCSGAMVTSQPWTQLTGGYARWVCRCVCVRACAHLGGEGRASNHARVRDSSAASAFLRALWHLQGRGTNMASRPEGRVAPAPREFNLPQRLSSPILGFS